MTYNKVSVDEKVVKTTNKPIFFMLKQRSLSQRQRFSVKFVKIYTNRYTYIKKLTKYC